MQSLQSPVPVLLVLGLVACSAEPSRTEGAAENGFRPGLEARVRRYVESGMRRRVFPGCQVVIVHHGSVVLDEAYGRETYDPGAPPITRETRYDLASLTKIVATTAVAMALHGKGELDLETRPSTLLEGFRGGKREDITLRHLLAHCSGLPGWKPLYKEAKSRRAMLEKIHATPLAYDPGHSMDYSDLGFMLLGRSLEEIGGKPLDVLARELVYAPLRMDATIFGPLPEGVPVAPTEDVPSRGGVIRGRVHDENAEAFEDVAGHAGLFSTAGDVARFLRAVLEARSPFTRETVELFTKRADLVIDSSRALGFDTPGRNSSAGRRMSPRSIGHTGFTGTSFWADRARGLIVVCLTNRVHPTRANKQIHSFRRGLHDLVVDNLLVDPLRK